MPDLSDLPNLSLVDGFLQLVCLYYRLGRSLLISWASQKLLCQHQDDTRGALLPLMGLWLIPVAYFTHVPFSHN